MKLSEICLFLPFKVVIRQMKKVSSHNKAMDTGLKPVIAKPGRTNNTYIFFVTTYSICLFCHKF